MNTGYIARVVGFVLAMALLVAFICWLAAARPESGPKQVQPQAKGRSDRTSPLYRAFKDMTSEERERWRKMESERLPPDINFVAPRSEQGKKNMARAERKRWRDTWAELLRRDPNDIDFIEQGDRPVTPEDRMRWMKQLDDWVKTGALPKNEGN